MSTVNISLLFVYHFSHLVLPAANRNFWLNEEKVFLLENHVGLNAQYVTKWLCQVENNNFMTTLSVPFSHSAQQLIICNNIILKHQMSFQQSLQLLFYFPFPSFGFDFKVTTYNRQFLFSLCWCNTSCLGEYQVKES